MTCPTCWINFTIQVENAPDFVNLTFAHEMTHKTLDELDIDDDSELRDDDGDGVPNTWEQAVPGMRWKDPAQGQEDPKDTDSFGNHFDNISEDSAASRDEEFYCVLGGAVSDFGEITDNELTGPYNGVVPEKANTAHDWSEGSENWKSDP